jgi:protein gp37
MADLFGQWVPAEWIEAVLVACRDAPQWTFLFLTKFPHRMARFAFPDNAWVGTSIDEQACVANAERAFRKIEAKVKWLSVEPMLDPLSFSDLGAFDWVVLGGASAQGQTPDWRPPDEWVDSLRTEADRLGIPVYEKDNLRRRRRHYPGLAPDEPSSAPAVLRRLPRGEDVSLTSLAAPGRPE